MANLEIVKRTAQIAADRDRQSYAVLNLNRFQPLYVIRGWKEEYATMRELVVRIDPQSN